MPMYEFYCKDCNTIFTFFSRSITTEKVPNCPKSSSHSLQKMVSRFAVTGIAKEKNESEEDGAFPDLPIDESRMEKAMEALAGEAESIDDNDPRQAADLMRKFSDMTGLQLGDRMEEALSRMEAGEDPETLEQEMGDLSESDLFKLKSRLSSARRAPLRDDTLYEM
ncbi:MAG: FmdB family zinc ribbon protein [Chitinispirillaceae bacterium]